MQGNGLYSFDTIQFHRTLYYQPLPPENYCIRNYSKIQQHRSFIYPQRMRKSLGLADFSRACCVWRLNDLARVNRYCSECLSSFPWTSSQLEHVLLMVIAQGQEQESSTVPANFKLLVNVNLTSLGPNQVTSQTESRVGLFPTVGKHCFMAKRIDTGRGEELRSLITFYYQY